MKRFAQVGFLKTVFRYGIVGLLSSVCYSLGVVALVDGLGVNPTIASIVVFVILVPLSYHAQRKFAFSEAPQRRGQGLRYAVTLTTSFVLSTVGMYVITEMLMWSYLIGIAYNWIAVPVTNMLVTVFWVFGFTPDDPHHSTRRVRSSE